MLKEQQNQNQVGVIFSPPKTIYPNLINSIINYRPRLFDLELLGEVVAHNINTKNIICTIKPQIKIKDEYIFALFSEEKPIYIPQEWEYCCWL